MTTAGREAASIPKSQTATKKSELWFIREHNKPENRQLCRGYSSSIDPKESDLVHSLSRGETELSWPCDLVLDLLPRSREDRGGTINRSITRDRICGSKGRIWESACVCAFSRWRISFSFSSQNYKTSSFDSTDRTQARKSDTASGYRAIQIKLHCDPDYQRSNVRLYITKRPLY